MFRVPNIPRVGKPRYTKLKQEDKLGHSDDGEEVLYDQQPQSEPMALSPLDQDFMFTSYDVDEDLSLPEEPSLFSKSRLPRCSPKRFLLLAALVTAVSAVLAFIVLYLVFRTKESNPPIDQIPAAGPNGHGQHPPQSPTPEVNVEYKPLNFTFEQRGVLTESTPYFVDLNKDGTLDVVMTVGRQESYTMEFWHCYNNETQKNACMEGFGFFPCGGSLFAIDGNTGAAIWTHTLTHEVFAATCEADVTGDHIPDCMMCGRSGIWEAVDGKTGAKIWDVDRTILNIFHNFYFPVAVGDLDQDGTTDFANIHGGDPRFQPDELERFPARFVVISGKNGQKLIEPILVPDMKESYMNPIRYKTEEEDFILFGSGGETVEGGLWAVTMSSLKQKVEEYIQVGPYQNYNNEAVTHPDCMEYPHKFAAQNSVIANHSHFTIADSLSKDDLEPFYQACPMTVFHPVPNVHHMCIYRVVNSPEKGVILPPVVLDMNGDNIDDLVISLYAGHTLVMDGSTGQVLWDRYIPGTESYSIPAPMFFNNDTVPDFFIRVNKGDWGTNYKYSYVGIVDGQNGELLWALNSSRAGFMSASTLRAQHHGEDAVLFMTVGQLPTDPLETIKSLEIVTIGNVTPHQYNHKRRAVQDVVFSPSQELDQLLGIRVKRDNISDDDFDALVNILSDSANFGDVDSTTQVSEDTDPAVYSSSVDDRFEQDKTFADSLASTSTDTIFPAASTPPGLQFDADSSSSSVPLSPTTSAETQGTNQPISASSSRSMSSDTPSVLSTTSSQTSQIQRLDDASVSSHTAVLSSIEEPMSAESLLVDRPISSSSVEIPVMSSPLASSVSRSSLSPVPSSAAHHILSSSNGILSTEDSTTRSPPSSESVQPSTSSKSSGQIPAELQSTSVSEEAGNLMYSAESSSETNLPFSEQTEGPQEPASTSSVSSYPQGVHTSSTGSELASDQTPIPTSEAKGPVGSYDVDGSQALMMEEWEKGWKRFEMLKSERLLEFWGNWSEVYKHNPVEDTKGFLEEDCHSFEPSSYVYFLTADMIRNKQTDKPLFTEGRRVLFPDMAPLYDLPAHIYKDPKRRKRHGDHSNHNEPETAVVSVQDILRDWGCHHIIHPSMVVSTPSFADLNGDGHIEVIYVSYLSFLHTNAFSEVPNVLSTSHVYIKVVTLEEAFKQEFGKDGVTVDFTTYAGSYQPWTKYMGADGDCRFNVLLK